VRFGDLPAQYQADARSARLGGEERNKQIRRVRQVRTALLLAMWMLVRSDDSRAENGLT